MRNADILFLGDSVHQVLFHKGQRAEIFTGAGGDLADLSGLEIDHFHRLRSVHLSFLKPYKIPSALGPLITVVVNPGCRALNVSGMHVHPEQHPVQERVDGGPVLRDINAVRGIHLDPFRILSRAQEAQFVDQRACCVEIIDADPVVALMHAAVHVPGYRKRHVAFRSHLQDPDRIFLVEVPLVHVRLLREPEDSCEDPAIPAVGPEHIFLDKCDDSCFFIRHIPDVLAGDAQDNPAVRQHFVGLRIEHLVRRALKIQQEDTAVREPQAVVLMDVVDLGAPVLRGRGDAVVQRHRRRALIDLGQARRRLVEDLRVELVPGQLLHAVMDIHVRQRPFSVRGLIRLHGRADRIQIRLVDAFVPESCCEIQIVRRVQAVCKKHVRIVIDIPAAGRHLKLQDILLVHQHPVSELQLRGDVIPVLLQADDLRIFQGLCPVDGDNLIGNRVHGSAEGLYADGHFSLLCQRRDRIAHLAHVHLMVVSVQAVEVDSPLLHIDQGKCG